MAVDEHVLGQFLGDDSFPIEWTSETEKKLPPRALTAYGDGQCSSPGSVSGRTTSSAQPIRSC